MILRCCRKNCRIIYLEDVREMVGSIDKLRGLIQRVFTTASLSRNGCHA